MGEDGGRGEQGEGIEHVGSEDVPEAADCSGPSLEVGDRAVASLPIGLDIAIHVEGVDMMEEGPVL